MALADILATIKKEMDGQVNKIESEGKKRMKELQAEFAEKEKAEKKRILEEAKSGAIKKSEQEKFKALNEKKSAVLHEKQLVLAETYDMSVKGLAELPDKDQGELLARLIKKLPRDKEGELKPAAKSAQLVQEANDKSKAGYKISDSVKGDGGFIFISPTLEIDNRYSALVEEAKEEAESEIAKILFS